MATIVTRIAYIGNFQPGERHPWSTETHYAASFEALGHHVLRLQENAMPSAAVATLRANAIELLLVTRTWNNLAPEWEAVTAEPPTGIISAAVHLDVFWGLARQGEIAEHAMFSAQHFFGVEGDHVEDYAEAGVNFHWLPPGVVDPDLVGEHVPGTPDFGRWPYDVGFVGSRGYHSEHPRTEFVDSLRARWGTRFVHIGGDGDYPTLRGQGLNDAYATIQVLAGDSCFAARDVRSCSDRFFESWGRGAFLVFPRIDFLEDMVGPYPWFEPGDWDEMHAVIEAALNDAAYREETKAKFGTLVRAEHTYTQRAGEIMRVLGLS